MSELIMKNTRSLIQSLLRPTLFALGTVLLVTSALAETYQWKNVAIKGGGFVSGLITHPNGAGVIYARTDIGGAYRWNSTNNSWIPLLDFAADATTYGVESLALDPSDSNRLYIAASRGSSPAILVSTDQGATFSSYAPPFALDGNYDGRSCGERMGVDPNSGNILFYGTRNSRLYKSTNYGASWTQVTFPVTTTSNAIGLVFVEFIKSSSTPGSATPTLFVGVSRVGTNLFRSTDGGVNWTGIPTGAGTNYLAHHAAQDGLGNMYLTFNDNQGPNNIIDGRVIKLNLSTLAAANVTPVKVSGEQGGFAGVSVDRQNPNVVAVSTMDRWWSPSPLAAWDQIYRSRNGGTNWIETVTNTLPISTSAPWSVARSPHWAGDVEIDPFNSNRVFFITGYGVIGCTNFQTSGASGIANWTFNSDGLEETVPLGLASPPSGANLLSAHGDIGGFRHYNLDVSPPLADYFSSHRGTSYGIDFAQNNPAKIVRLFSGTPYGCYSLDGGGTWSDFPTAPSTIGNGVGSIAISADGSRMVWMPSSSVAYYSANNGTAWTASSGGPTASRVPVADRVNSSKFYIYNSTRMYVSTDGGATYGLGGTTTSSGGGPPCAVFGYEGHVLLPLPNGLWRTTNSGTTLSQLPGVQQASYVGVGKAAPGQDYPAIFIIGQVGGVTGIYRSDDQGANWIRINDSQHQFGLSWIHDFCADPRVYGRVYFGTEGRGVIYGELVQLPPAAPASLQASAGDGQATLIWAASSGATNYYVKRSTVSGNSYNTIATNAGVTFTDAGLNNGTMYYYVVSALGAGGESDNSVEAGARPFSLEPSQLSWVNLGSQVQLTWPQDHIGWQLQAQTNAPGDGVSTNWVAVSGSTLTNLFTADVDAANGSVFFRLLSP
jgi:hypothetical protein